MAFRIVVTHRAQLDIDEHTLFIARDSPPQAKKWKDRLEALILSLDESPSRFSLIAEAEGLNFPYRSAIHYSHRVVFRIDDASNTVYVVRVYQGARRPLTPRDVA